MKEAYSGNMKKLIISSLAIAVVSFAQAYSNSVPGTWVKFLEKPASPHEFTELFVFTGAGNTTHHISTFGFSTMIQIDGELPTNAPFDNGFQGDLFNNSIEYDVSGHIESGNTYVNVTVDVETALNSDGSSAWQGWHYDTGGVITDAQTRKQSWKIYPGLPLVAQ